MTKQKRIAIVGGGVIGLSLAWELARRGQLVSLYDSGEVGRKASWAGAGILAPTNAKTFSHPLDKLMGRGSELHRSWTQLLKEESGIDNGYIECGGIYLARTPGERAALAGQRLYWEQYEIDHQRIEDVFDFSFSEVLRLNPGDTLVQVPGESQICNPHHLEALRISCEKRSIEIKENIDADFRLENGVLTKHFAGERQVYDQVCFCTGAWTARLLKKMQIAAPMIPVRGQMLLFKLEKQSFSQIINEGSRYIVPRRDGYVLAGSTTEEVGFDETTTEEKLAELMEFASSIVPSLNETTLAKSWAGLRPASFDGFPYMGRIPNTSNGFVAAGHFKAGLQMSPAVAVLMADLMTDDKRPEDAEYFDPGRLDLSESLHVHDNDLDDISRLV